MTKINRATIALLLLLMTPAALLAQDSKTRKDMNKKVDDFFKTKKVPGLVVLYAKNGKMTYERIKGEADMEKDVKMTANKIMRHASVDKLIAAVLAVRLEEKGKLNLNKKVRHYLPSLPAHHDYRVIDLIRCRSGVRHYGGTTSSKSPKGWSNKQYDWAYTAAKKFWHDPLVNKYRDYSYSTHGYTILAAVLEKVTGKKISSIVRDELNKPFGLHTLAAENINQQKTFRVKLYKYDAKQKDRLKPVERDNISWKVLGGGMESSPLDLLRFMVLLGDGKIISKKNVERLMKRVEADRSYAMGCNHGIVNGYHYLAKSGNQTGANTYVWVAPKARAAMIVMTNRSSRKLDNGKKESMTSKLGRSLRNLVMNSSASNQESDLIVTQFERTAAPYYKDGKIKIPVRLRIKNIGAGPTYKKASNGFVQDKFVNGIRIGKKYYWTAFHGSMTGGEQTGWIKTTISIPDRNKLQAGRTIKLEAMADAPIAAADTSVDQKKARIKESNESNNSKLLSVKIPGGVGGFSGKQPSQGNQANKPPRSTAIGKKKGTKKKATKKKTAKKKAHANPSKRRPLRRKSGKNN